VKQELRVKGYVRSVDDFLLYGASRAEVRAHGEAAREDLRGLRLELHPDKYRALRCAEGVDFCGFVVRADGRVRVRARSAVATGTTPRTTCAPRIGTTTRRRTRTTMGIFVLRGP